jgi:hypothetical protein
MEIPSRSGTYQSPMGEWSTPPSGDRQWEAYVRRHPGPALAGAALLGLMAGCWITGGFKSKSLADDEESSSRMYMGALAQGRSDLAGRDRLPAVRASWHKLASRLEGLVNRAIDEMADATERMLVPTLVSRIETLFEGQGRRAAREPF